MTRRYRVRGDSAIGRPGAEPRSARRGDAPVRDIARRPMYEPVHEE